MREHFDIGYIIVIFVTVVLFAMALFTKGFTHDLLLEAGVLLVSIKLIVMADNNSVSNKEITKALRDIKTMLNKNDD